MKKIFTFLVFVFLFCLSLQAQQYQKIYDNPDDVIKGHLGIEYYGVDAGLDNLSGAMLMAVGLNGHYQLNKRINLEASAQMPLLRLENKGTAYLFDGGAELSFYSAIRQRKNVRVLISWEESTNLFSDTYTRTIKYVDFPGTIRKSWFLRGGAYLRNSSYEFELDQINSEITTISNNGIYLGIGTGHAHFFHVKEVNTGHQWASAVIMKFFADLLVLPTKITITQQEKSETLGWRAGWKFFNNPFTKKQNFGRGKGFFGNTLLTVELGKRPLEGFYLGGTVSYILKKF